MRGVRHLQEIVRECGEVERVPVVYYRELTVGKS